MGQEIDESSRTGSKRDKKDMKQFPAILHIQGERNKLIRIRILGSLVFIFSL